MPQLDLASLETPALILDTQKLKANCQRMLDRIADTGLTLRPHFKTAKSVDAVLVATNGRRSTVTASTLREVEVLAEAGFRDILYAVGITPNKFARVRSINQKWGVKPLLSLDSPEMAQAVAEGLPGFHALIEIDCGEHRGGRSAQAPELLQMGRLLGPGLKGVMSHAGHSYCSDDPDRIRQIARAEADAARQAAQRLRADGQKVDVVSIGSTPTALFADSLDGITELRAGIYMLWDLAQLSRGMCGPDDIAATVLTTVIGHNRAAGVLTVDAGALAMSKDVSAQTFLPTAGYGWLRTADMKADTGLRIDAVHQEHGTVQVRSPRDFDSFPIGSQLRVLPNHACLTCAAGYGQFHTTDGRVWPRTDGW